MNSSFSPNTPPPVPALLDVAPILDSPDTVGSNNNSFLKSMKLLFAAPLQISMPNHQECGAIVPFSQKMHMLPGPEIVEAVYPAETKRNPEFLRRVSSGAKSPGNF